MDKDLNMNNLNAYIIKSPPRKNGNRKIDVVLLDEPVPLNRFTTSDFVEYQLKKQHKVSRYD